MLEIPLTADENDFTVEFEADDLSVVLHMRWNSEIELWVLGLQTLAGERILYGLPLINRRFLLEPYSGLSGVPAGELFVSCDTEANPGRDDFLNGSARMYYLSEAENAAL